MFRHIINDGLRYSFLALPSLFGDDRLTNETETERKADKVSVKEETGWDRLVRMYQVDEFGNISYEANSILQVMAGSIFVGAAYGGLVGSRGAYQEFMQSQNALKFESHLEAKKMLQNKVTIAFGKSAFRWSWRLALFCTSFAAISTTIQVYRGKYGIMEYVAAGSLTGTLYKFNMGPRGWLVGGGLGSVLGLFCGGMTLAILKITGVSMEEARYWQYQWKQYRSEYFRKGMADYLEKEDYAVVKLHNDSVGEAGKDIANLDKEPASKNTK
nr:RPII140-upstream gene protein [Leptinotarsa decemlineata]